ncbi:hypothetical protein NQ315_013173 [Exocentrus adspersus]|uniref:CCHC-type domain-containing protein n=1 Tax=Exocentrus adspersus TaxID=1586481 RepID=A0AAV8VCR1_9CUCU|nr:hypothetical protein NQ315_013173 [Exocentrus adspersus]
MKEEDKATSLITALRGEALEVLQTIPEASPNYATLTSALERRPSNNTKPIYQEWLTWPIQRAPAEVIDFIEGLRDPEIGQLVMLSRHKTISKALAHALEIEAVEEASRVAINPYQHRDKKTKITDGNLIDSLLELWQQFKKRQDLGSFTLNGERKPICCWTCGAEGHVIRRCPQNGSLQKAPGPSTSQVRQIRVYTRQNQDVKMKKTHTYLDDWMSHILEKHKNKRYSENSTFNKRRRIRRWTYGAEAAEGHMRSCCQKPNSVVKNPGVSEITRPKGRRPMGCYQAQPSQKIPLQCDGSSLIVPGRVCDRECQMIVDTGSSHTIVKPNIVTHCRIQQQGTDERYHLVTARDEWWRESHLAEIRIGNKTYKQKVFVADTTDDVLLGLDVMSRDFILDLPRGIMKINDEEVPLNVLKTAAMPTRKVRIVEDTTLLPESGVRAEVRCNQDSKNEEVLVVGSESKLCRPRELVHHRRGNKECADDNL